MTDSQINRLARQTQYAAHEIKEYIARVTASGEVADAVLFANIREADMFDIDINLLGR